MSALDNLGDIGTTLNNNWDSVVDNAGGEPEGNSFSNIFKELFTDVRNFVSSEDINNRFEEAGLGDRASVKYDAQDNTFELTYQPLEGETVTETFADPAELLDFSFDIIGFEHAETENSRLEEAGLGLLLQVNYDDESNSFTIGHPDGDVAGLWGPTPLTGEQVTQEVDAAITWAQENPSELIESNKYQVEQNINQSFSEAGFGDRASITYDSESDTYELSYQPLEGEAITETFSNPLDAIDFSNNIIGLEHAETENARLEEAGLGLLLEVKFDPESNTYRVGQPGSTFGDIGFATAEELSLHIDGAISWAQDNPAELIESNKIQLTENINNLFSEVGLGDRASITYDSETQLFTLTYQPLEGEAFTETTSFASDIVDYSNQIIGTEHADAESARLKEAGFGDDFVVSYNAESNTYTVGGDGVFDAGHGPFTREEVTQFVDEAVQWASENPGEL